MKRFRPHSPSPARSRSQTYPHRQIFVGSPQVVKVLVAVGVELHKGAGARAIQWALQRGHMETVQELTEALGWRSVPGHDTERSP